MCKIKLYKLKNKYKNYTNFTIKRKYSTSSCSGNLIRKGGAEGVFLLYSASSYYITASFVLHAASFLLHTTFFLIPSHSLTYPLLPSSSSSSSSIVSLRSLKIFIFKIIFHFSSLSPKQTYQTYQTQGTNVQARREVRAAELHLV